MQQALLKKLIQLTLNKDRQQALAAALNWLEAFSIARGYLADWLNTEGRLLEPLVAWPRCFSPCRIFTPTSPSPFGACCSNSWKCA